jgi:hypothetical protein
MADKILGSPLEELEQIPKQIVGQTAKLPIDIGKGVVEGLVKGTGSSGQSQGKRIDPLTGIEIPSKGTLRRLRKKEKRIKAQGLPQTRGTIAAGTSIKKPVAVPPPYIAGKAGFSQDKFLEALSEGEIPKKKKKLPPPVSSTKPKWGTAERKLGVSG